MDVKSIDQNKKTTSSKINREMKKGTLHIIQEIGQMLRLCSESPCPFQAVSGPRPREARLEAPAG